MALPTWASLPVNASGDHYIDQTALEAILAEFTAATAGDRNGGGKSLSNNDAVYLKRILDTRTGAPALRFSTGYNFVPQAPGGSLTAGAPATVTLTPVPRGLNASNPNHYLYISGGTGTAEAVLVTGGTAVSGSASGTVTFTPAYSHSGAWTVASASAGVKEAIEDLPVTGGTIIIPPGAYTIYQSIIAGNGALGVESDIQGIHIEGAGRGATALKWAGAASGIMVEFRGPMNDGGLSDITLDCDSIAATGLKILAHSTASYRRITVLGNTGYAFTADVWPTQGAGPAGTGDNTLEDLTAQTTETLGSGLSIGAESAATSAEIDPCRNTFRRLNFYIGQQGIGIKAGYTDSSSFTEVFVLGGIAGLYLRTPGGDWGQYFPGALDCYSCYFHANSITQVAISGASNASPIRITTATPHGLTTGMRVAVSGVRGNTAANGVWTVTAVNGTTLDLDDSTGNGAYTSGGYIGSIPVLAKGNGPANSGGGIKDGASFWPWNIEMGDPPQENWAHGITATGKPFGLQFSRQVAAFDPTVVAGADPLLIINQESGANNAAGMIEARRVGDPRVRVAFDYFDGIGIYTRSGTGAFVLSFAVRSDGTVYAPNLPVYADNATALGSLGPGGFYAHADGSVYRSYTP